MGSAQGADAPMMSDAFMAFRLMMSYLEDLSMATDPTTGRLRGTAIIESGTITTVSTVTTVTTVATVTNVANFGSNQPTDGFLRDIMDIVWNTGIRPQII
jgi:hypothetical protein